jgi:4-amino-4-deoxy-L-arabinose transferase-like glycosyltransferase
MLDETEVTEKNTGRPVLNLRRTKIFTLLGRVGLGLLILAALAWLVTFPTFQLVQAALSGDLSLFQPRQPSGLETFFRNYPQIIWFGFGLGALLFFAFRQTPVTLQPSPPSGNVKANNPGSKALKLGLSMPGRAGTAWWVAGIVALGLILVLAAVLRIGDARNIGATNLIHTDYDEGVHSTAALLMTQGKSIYRDFFLTQPPVGPFLWSIPLRLNGTDWGGLTDFLRLRLFTSLIALVTIALVYLTGRKLGGKWAGPIAGAIAAFTLAVDGSAVRTEQQIMLEPLVNVFTAAAIFAFVNSVPGENRQGRRWLIWPLAAGLLAGLAVSVKIPALAVVLGLGLTLVAWRYWRGLGMFVAGVVGGYLVASAGFLIASGSAFIKEAYLYQLLRPFNNIATTGQFSTETTLTAFDYLAHTPYLGFTLLMAGLGLVAIVLRWATRSGGENWLPVTLVAVVTLFLYTGKAGFFPHYYDHMALPLALMAGGVVNFKLPRTMPWQLQAGVGSALALGLALLLWPAVNFSLSNPNLPEWSQERAVDATFNNLDLSDDGKLLTWDARYSFIMGQPLTVDANNQYVVDSAAYVEYLGLGLSHQNLTTAVSKVFFDQNSGDMRQLRYIPLVQNDLYGAAQKSDFVLVEARADSQLTDQTLETLKANFINRLDTEDIDVYVNQRQMEYKSGAKFGDNIQLVGFDADNQLKLTPENHKIPLTLFWRGTAKIQENYVIFFHLLNEKGETVAQRDTAPRYGQLNTIEWTPNELFDDDQSLEVPANLPPGRYKIELGMYRPTDGKRLTVTQAAPGQWVTSGGDSLILFEVNIVGL